MAEELPNIAKLLAPLFARVAKHHRPFLLAAAERSAAIRYRGWSEQHLDPSVKAGLLACAQREDEIARRVESLDPAAVEVQQRILDENPDLANLNDSVFGQRPLDEQFRIQAAGERAGAASWTAFSDAATDPRFRDVFRSCVELEIANAAFLESLLEEPV